MRGGLRRRLMVSVIAVSALALALLVAGFNVALRSSLNGDANSLVRARAQAALEGVRIDNGRVSTHETSDQGAPDAQLWIYDGTKNIERPRADHRLDALADQLLAQGSGSIDDNTTDTRLYAQPIRSEGETVGTIVSSVDLEPYERTSQRTLLASIALGVLMLGLISVVTRILISRSLRPVAEMTETVAGWSVNDLDRRFEVGPPTDELTNLAATFDNMLDRMAATVRHERSFAAEVSHELRTPLSAIAAEAEIALRRDRDASEYKAALGNIAGRSVELNGIVETLLEAARAESEVGLDDTCLLRDAIAEAAGSFEQMAQSMGVELVVEDAGLSIAVEGAKATIKRILAPVIENAVVYAKGRAVVRVSSTADLAVLVSDDGPGFGVNEARLAFEPGKRGAAPRNPDAPAGTGLGLPLARRLARTVGGDVAIGENDHGATVRVSLRTAQTVV